ncbi:hypothetical protein [Endozoicomonas sp.]|uniref:hypothetical protein n=1 Tax=Endozoicomonas sp. TaxID=1892382 RepID=UPI00383B19FF
MPAVLSRMAVCSDARLNQSHPSGKHKKARGKATARSGGRGVGHSDEKNSPRIRNENTEKTSNSGRPAAQRKCWTSKKAPVDKLSVSTVVKAVLVGGTILSGHFAGAASLLPSPNGTALALPPANGAGRLTAHSDGNTNTQICTQSQVFDSEQYITCNNRVQNLIHANATNANDLKHCLEAKKTCNYNVLQTIDDETVIDYSRNEIGGCNPELQQINDCQKNQTVLNTQLNSCKQEVDQAVKARNQLEQCKQELELSNKLELRNQLEQCKQEQEQEQCKQEQEQEQELSNKLDQCNLQLNQCEQEQSQSSLGLPFWLILGIALGSAVCICGVCAFCKKSQKGQNCIDKLTRQSQKSKKAHHGSDCEMRETHYPLMNNIINQPQRRGSSSF